MAALLLKGIVQLQKSVIFNSTKGAKRTGAFRNENIRKGTIMPNTIRMRRAVPFVLGEELAIWVSATRGRFADYRTYRQSISELADLSTRELADLGLHRSEIKRVAYETVYGQRS